MARNYSPQTSDFPFHITGRCQNKSPFPIDLEGVWKVFEEELFLSKIKYNFKVNAFVLMPNHFHLLASTVEIPLGVILRELVGNTSRRINEASLSINHLWGNKTYRCLIDSQEYFSSVYRYIYQNPVRAGLVGKCEDWPYSTLHGLLGLRKIFVPIEEDTNLFNPNFQVETLNWLNNKIPDDKIEIIRRGLKKRTFKVIRAYASTDKLLD